MADRPIGRSSDVTDARVVHLRFPACPIERSRVAQKSSGGLPFDFAKKCSEIRFCEREFVRFEQAYIFEVGQSRFNGFVKLEVLWLPGVRFVHLGASAWPIDRSVDQAK